MLSVRALFCLWRSGRGRGGREENEPEDLRERSPVRSRKNSPEAVPYEPMLPLALLRLSARRSRLACPPMFVSSAAQNLLAALERGKRVDAPMLRAAMESAFGGSDAQGAWDWKMAYDACEAATVLFLRKFGHAMRARAGSPAALLPMLSKIAGLLPAHTRRSEESQALQQFSTPIALGLVARVAAAITPAESGPRAFGRDRAAGDPRRARRRVACFERTGRDPSRLALPSVSRRRGDPLRRRAD